jgi:DNA-binding transcriptional MerR regulator
MSENHDQPLRIGRLARLTGLSTDTLRHYERRGLLSPRRSPNGYRRYPPEAVDRVRLVQRALSVGFTLDELGRVFRIRERGGAPCREVRELAASKLRSMEEQLHDLMALRDQLQALIATWDARLARTPKGKRAKLLDTWSQAPENTGARAASAAASGGRKTAARPPRRARTRGPARRSASPAKEKGFRHK